MAFVPQLGQMQVQTKHQVLPVFMENCFGKI